MDHPTKPGPSEADKSCSTLRPSTAQLRPVNRDHLDTRLTQFGVRVLVLRVCHHHHGLDGQEVVPVVPLLMLGLELITSSINPT